MTLRRLMPVAAVIAALSAPTWAQDAGPALSAAPFTLDDGNTAQPTPPEPRATVSLDSAETEDLKALILDTLVENPDVLVQALTLINAQQVQAREAIAARDAHIRTVATNAIGAPVTGNPEGDVTIVVFSDYNCAECRTAEQALRDVVSSDGKIRVVHRTMPVMGTDSTQAAKAALAADMQGKFAPFHAALTALEGSVTTQSVLKAALESGIDINKLLVDQEGPAISAQIEDTRTIAKDFGFEGAPAFFIGTMVATGAPDAADLRDAVAQERARQAEQAAES